MVLKNGSIALSILGYLMDELILDVYLYKLDEGCRSPCHEAIENCRYWVLGKYFKYYMKDTEECDVKVMEPRFDVWLEVCFLMAGMGIDNE